MTIAVLNGFEVRANGRLLRLPMTAQRLLAFLALHPGTAQRLFVAGRLWPDVREERSVANLRSALWRLRRVGPALVEAAPLGLALAPDVTVDLQVASARAHQVIRHGPGDTAADTDELLVHDVLPDWYDEWVDAERERFRQLRLHALEALSERLLAAGRTGEAVEIALAAVSGEPLRESAQRTLIKAHLVEGNPGEALRQYRSYRRLIRDELGLEPSPRMTELLHGLLVTPA